MTAAPLAAGSDRRAEEESTEQIVAATRRWLEIAVLGLGLCPFAAAPYRGERVRYRVSAQRSTTGLVHDLTQELEYLQSADPLLCETSLLIHPFVLADFFDYNQFLGEADDTVRALRLDGTLQIASFHPAYQFAGSDRDDAENYSNRSPYPMLHLLREVSVSRAVATHPDVNAIVERNKGTLRKLGAAGWHALFARDGQS